MNAQMYDSPFCNVQYIEKDHVVLLAWKKACSFGDYRSPSLFMYEKALKALDYFHEQN